MDVFAQKKFLIRIVIALTLLNVLCIGVFVWKDFKHRPPHPPMHGEYRDVTGILEKELQLSSSQMVQFNTLRVETFEKERAILDILRSERDSMNETMFNKVTSDSIVKNMALRISQNEYKMEMLRFEQAKALKKICTPEQLDKFKELTMEIRDYFRPDNQPRRR